jgi:hypothetical protein
MIKLLFRLIMVGLILLVLFLLLGASFIQKAGNALIDAVNGSAAHGLAQIFPSSGNTSQLQLNLQGLPPNGHYDVTLDQGTCGGSLFQDIGLVTSDANGNATSTFTISDISKDAQQNLWVDVHQGPDKSYPSTACGQVELNSTAPSQPNLNGSANSSTSSSSSTTGVSNTGSNSSHAGNQNTSDNSPGLPNSGVAPGGSNSYDNYTFPRKY